jgi:hypothetical protein
MEQKRAEGKHLFGGYLEIMRSRKGEGFRTAE